MPKLDESFKCKNDDLELDSRYFNQNSLYRESSKDYNIYNILDDCLEKTPYAKSPMFAGEENSSN